MSSLDSLARHRVEGYGYISFPRQPGAHELLVRTWRPVCSLRTHLQVSGTAKVEADHKNTGDPQQTWPIFPSLVLVPVVGLALLQPFPKERKLPVQTCAEQSLRCPKPPSSPLLHHNARTFSSEVLTACMIRDTHRSPVVSKERFSTDSVFEPRRQGLCECVFISQNRCKRGQRGSDMRPGMLAHAYENQQPASLGSIR